MKVESVQRHTLKILAVLFALSLWVYVLNSEPIVIEKKLPINFILPKGMVLNSLNENEVTLKLKGSKAFISNVFSNNEMVQVNLEETYKFQGKNFVQKIYASNLEVPFGVEIIDIHPKEMNIELDILGQMEVPVKVQFYGEIPKNKKLKEFKVSPDKIKIKGPVNLLKNINKIETAPVNMALLKKDEGELKLIPTELDSRLDLENIDKLILLYKTKK